MPLIKRFWVKVFILILVGIPIYSGAAQAQEKKTKSHLPEVAKPVVINIAYLGVVPPPPGVQFILDPPIKDQGYAGAKLGVDDNNTTGKFTGQQYQLKTYIVPQDANPVDVFEQSMSGKYDYIVVDLPSKSLLAIADSPKAKSSLIYDVYSSDDNLRGTDCRSNILHLLPSRAMRADALAQYLVKKRWTKWFLVAGDAPEDQLFADALKRSIKRFAINVVAEKLWKHDHDARQTAQSEIAVFTQIDEDYDVLVVADEQGRFGEYLNYRTWVARPVVGTQGLIPTAWHPAHEQWGAIQIQNRFKEQTGRWMTERDYASYIAVRALGEAVVRSQSTAPKAVKDYTFSDQFALQGYKGSPLSFRTWDGQLRQPVLLASPRSIVEVAPVEGYLHPKTELDTLGYDEPETQCKERIEK